MEPWNSLVENSVMTSGQLQDVEGGLDFLDQLSEPDQLPEPQIPEPTVSVGYRFVPTDQELINSYLRGKANDNFPEVDDLNIYTTDPSSIQFNDTRYVQGERYFFVERQTMSNNEKEKRPKRTMTTGNVGGYWRANTGDKQILDENNQVIGYKKSLTFFQYEDINNKDRKKAKKSDWIMHEYRLSADKFERWALCRIRQKPMTENK